VAEERIRKRKPLIGANNIQNNRTRKAVLTTGYNSFFKYPGQNFADVEDDVALGYEEAKPGAALPWDTVRPAVNAMWARLGGIISPRDPSRGVREWL
jgi:hypothetical protein